MPRVFDYLKLRRSSCLSENEGMDFSDSDEDSSEDCMSTTDFELRPIRNKLTLNHPKQSAKMVDIKPDRLILEPGQDIRPNIDHDGVKLLVERLYGISALELTELDGYDDKNYKIIEDPNVKNPLITEHCADGYVLKIMNSMDSRNLEVVEAQNEIMNFLNARSVVCPKPIRNVFGHLHSVETLGGKQHAVRLLQFVPGDLLKQHAPRDALLYQLGQTTANLDNKLQNFNHSGVMNREHIWMLSKVPELEKFKYVLKETEKLDLAEEVIEEFKYAVVPQLGDLEKGVIHGDINEANVLVTKAKDKDDYQISGILDFGDIQYGPYVFELAIAMTYAMLIGGGPRAGGLVLAGYQVTRRVPREEYRLLKTLVSARLVQSLVLGAYTRSQHPGNEYVTSTERLHGWQLLTDLRKRKYAPEEQDPTDWQAIADQYLTRS